MEPILFDNDILETQLLRCRNAVSNNDNALLNKIFEWCIPLRYFSGKHYIHNYSQQKKKRIIDDRINEAKIYRNKILEYLFELIVNADNIYLFKYLISCYKNSYETYEWNPDYITITKKCIENGASTIFEYILTKYGNGKIDQIFNKFENNEQLINYILSVENNEIVNKFFDFGNIYERFEIILKLINLNNIDKAKLFINNLLYIDYRFITELVDINQIELAKQMLINLNLSTNGYLCDDEDIRYMMDEFIKNEQIELSKICSKKLANVKTE